MKAAFATLGLSEVEKLGIGLGDWNLITEETLGPSMGALCDSVRCAATLPSRFASWMPGPGEGQGEDTARRW